MKKFLLIALLAACFQAGGQTVADFENFNLSPGSFINDAEAENGFSVGNIFLPNDYNADWMAWSGWAISATTDVATPGFTNDLSAIAGGGYGGSTTYGTSYVLGDSRLVLTGAAAGGAVEGMYVTNSTYAFLSMLEGDAFAKKFGGESGNDPDFFRLTVKKYLQDELSTDSVTVYLADFRFANNAQDYILQDWAWLDLTSLGNADSLQFTMQSSDVGAFGINTPTYFCADDVTTTDMVSGNDELLTLTSISVFPNPFSEILNVEWKHDAPANLKILTADGRLVSQANLAFGQNTLQLGQLTKGSYFVEIQSIGIKVGFFVVKN